MKRLASTQTLGSTSAINSDKTGTLTLNQMTAVQMTAAGRRYAVGEGRRRAAAQADGEFRQRYLAENQRLGEQGLRVIATARKDFDPAAFDPGADVLPLVTGLELLALVGIVDPPPPPPGHRSRRRRRPASGSG